MGTLSNSVFQALLGWIRTLSSEIWSTVTAPDSSTILRWVGQNWLSLAAGLCVFGLIADWMIYLFRWQPYRVWRSFFRRKRRGGAEPEEADFPEDEDDPEEKEYPEEEDPEDAGFRGSYARYAYDAAEPDDPEEEQYLSEPQINMAAPSGGEDPSGRAEWSAPRRRSFIDAADPEEEIREGLESHRRDGGLRREAEPRETEAEKTDPVPWRRNEPGGTTAEFDQALRPRRRRRVARLFSEGNEDTVSPDQLIDQYAAYRRPVYPRSWQKEETAEEDKP